MKQSVLLNNETILQLASGPSTIRIAPQFGARLLDWRADGREIIRWPEQTDWSLVNKTRGGNPILFPFIARHMVDGEIGKWIHPDGRILDLPMHGFARDLPFAVQPGSPENEVLMRLEDNETSRSGYPYAFRFEVLYRLEPGALTCVLTATNRSSGRMPWQAGHHFYFAVPAADRASWSATISSRQWGRQNLDGSITYLPAASDSFPLSDPESIDRFQLLVPGQNACLEGPAWKLDFDLNLPGSLPWHTVTTWTQTPESDFYCIEPWLGLPNAIHHGDGIRWLEPGQTEQAACTLRLG